MTIIVSNVDKHMSLHCLNKCYEMNCGVPFDCFETFTMWSSHTYVLGRSNVQNLLKTSNIVIVSWKILGIIG